MSSLSKYVLTFSLGLLIGLCAMYAALHHGSDKPMPTGDADVPKHEIKASVPVKALDKKTLHDRGAISSSTEKDKEKEVLATGKDKTSDGTKTVAAVLDTKTGDTVITEHKPFMEFMKRHEFGVGYGLYDGSLAKGAQYRFTFGRIWKFYGTLQVEGFEVDRMDNRHPWNAMVFATLRF